MNTKFAATIMAMSLAMSLGISGGAQAKGCIRGAIAGGIAGHYAGHHTWTGAAAGCIAGRHYYKQKRLEQQQVTAARACDWPGDSPLTGLCRPKHRKGRPRGRPFRFSERKAQ